MTYTYKQIKEFSSWINEPGNKQDLEQFKEQVEVYYNSFLQNVENDFIEDGELVDVLCIDKVEGGTFEDQEEPYTRIQFCFGGPTVEVRIYSDRGEWESYSEWVFLGWFSGIGIELEDHEIRALKDAYCIE